MTFLFLYDIIYIENEKGSIKMYICPACGKELPTEPEIVKHFLACWKEHNPRHKSKSAPHSVLTDTQINSDVMEFFAKYES